MKNKTLIKQILGISSYCEKVISILLLPQVLILYIVIAIIFILKNCEQNL